MGAPTGWIDKIALVGTTVYVSAPHVDEAGGPMLISYNAANGEQRILVPTPPAWPALNVDPAALGLSLTGLLSWVVAP